MKEEAPPAGGLGQDARQRRGRWPRRTPYGLRRDSRRWNEASGFADECSEPTYAALDLGTNNCRLLIARPTTDGFRVVDAFSRIIRLGEGVAASRRISEAAIKRAVEALLVCRDKMRARGVTSARARLIATEACRAAENGEAFRQRVAEQAGLELEIVDSATEARLAAAGCTELFDPAATGVILFDIGGGSSELVRLGPPNGVRRGPPLPDIAGWVSLPVGVVTLAERYGGTVVSQDIYDAMVKEVSRVVAELIAMNFDQRAANPCIGAERADLVLAGCAILDAIRQFFPCGRLRVADRGLREGMLVEMMRANGVWGEA